MVSLSDHQGLEPAPFGKLRLSGHQWTARLCQSPAQTGKKPRPTINRALQGSSCPEMPDLKRLQPRFWPECESLHLLSIPAPAGEPSCPEACAKGRWVYPRACGGTIDTRGGIVTGSGLSPRLRGNHLEIWAVMSHLGSIPAPAGEPWRRTRLMRTPKVYPRACGGTLVIVRLDRQAPGLSPRLRGNQVVMVAGAVAAGSIPAPAGEPPARRDSRRPMAVYPRACGGTRRPSVRTADENGLSPRLRAYAGGRAKILVQCHPAFRHPGVFAVRRKGQTVFVGDVSGFDPVSEQKRLQPRAAPDRRLFP